MGGTARKENFKKQFGIFPKAVRNRKSEKKHSLGGRDENPDLGKFGATLQSLFGVANRRCALRIPEISPP